MTPARFLTALLLVALAATGASAAPTGSEHYAYDTFLTEDPARAREEAVTMTIEPCTNGVQYQYRSRRRVGWEEVTAMIDSNRQARSAIRTEYTEGGTPRLTTAIRWQEPEVTVTSVRPDGRTTSRTFSRTDDPLVMDVTLLYALRFFPFEEPNEVRYRMVAFTGHSVTLHFQPAGIETVEVPAGTFECYRLEGYVDLIFKKLRMTYWLSREAPHFLVKYEGKRGIFLAPSFTTVLVSTPSP
jgi:hypothetical protein